MFNGGFGSRNSFRRDGNQSRGGLGSSLRKPNWSELRLEKIDRNHYSESRDVSERSSRDIKNFFAENEITVKGRENVKPIFSFSEISLPSALTRRLAQLKFTKPTAIQSVTIPVALSGYNVVGIAQTGSGKTLTYLLPAFDHISRMSQLRRGDGPIVLVLVPTRELAQQVQSVANDVSTGYKTACVYGGTERRRQMNLVSQGVHVVVATPGRLIDFMEQGVIDLKSRCSLLIMDEADRMLDLGFEPQIRIILQQIRPDRHLLMFSATWPKAVHRLVNDFMTEYHHVTVGNPDICSNHNITQIVEVVDENSRDERFESILSDIMEKRANKTLVFCETKRKTDEVSWRINRLGYKSASIHGDKTQMERERILQDFKSSRLSILVATDVASRGLDVQDIKFVVNYDFPNCTEDYIHRIGRTGRAQKSGTSYTLLTPKHFRQARDLIKILKEANQEVPRSLMSLDGNNYSQRGRNNFSRWGNGNDNRNGDRYRQSNRSFEPYGKRRYDDSSNYQSNNNYSQQNYGREYQNNDSYFMPPPPPKKPVYSEYTTCPPPPPPPRRT